MAFARAATDRRFVFIIQRGAADGLHIVAPTGDPAYAGLRGDFAEDFAGGAKLGSFFTLHPALAETAKMYADKQALFVHAVASPYRDRSHFDGQNVLETGGSAAYRLQRRLDEPAARPAAGRRGQGARFVDHRADGASRAHEVSSYAQSQLPSATDDLLSRVGALYASDQQLHGLWSAAMDTRMKAGDPMQAGGGQNGAAIGSLAAKMLAGDGARIAMIETNGWDTHSGQRGRLNAQLRNLDQTLASLKTGLGARLGEHAGRRCHRVRPHGAAQRHRRYRPRPGLGGDAARRRGRRRDSNRRLAGPDKRGAIRRPRPQADDRPRRLIAGALSQHYALEPVRVMPTLFPDSRGSALRQPLINA